MKLAIVILLFLLLLVFSWPLALAALILIPLLLLVTLPFRLIFWAIQAIFSFFKMVLFLPARLLGFKG